MKHFGPLFQGARVFNNEVLFGGGMTIPLELAETSSHAIMLDIN